ncbi:MAG: LuxR C-terminal-related transcriptional regulator [Burkholderiaceae bacterium]
MWTSQDLAFKTRTYPDASAGRFAGMDAGLLMRMMDEIDHGMLVIDDQCRLRHANHLARHALATGRFIACHGQTLMGTSAEFTQQIDQALKLGLKGHRQLVSLKVADAELTLAFVPLSHSLETDTPSVLVLLSRQNACENLAVRMYARAHQLSNSEEQVLIGLCKGYTIPEIAEAHGVAPSTIRTQVKALRHKTGCNSIRMIMLRVNSLPPMVSALRTITPMEHNDMALV